MCFKLKRVFYLICRLNPTSNLFVIVFRVRDRPIVKDCEYYNLASGAHNLVTFPFTTSVVERDLVQFENGIPECCVFFEATVLYKT